ncbi:MAG: HDOD domain-containing protein [Treponema sp.]|nr:HDOD domain-containing protein [Treponema sp.]
MANSNIPVNIEMIRNAIKSGVPLVLTTYTFPRKVEAYVDDVIRVFLKELNQQQMTETLSFCMKELANNGKKANTKRVYFEEKKLDLNKSDEYKKGMEAFKTETLTNQKFWLELQKNKGFYIKIVLQAANNKIKLEVRNKCELNVNEYKRIHDKITRATMFDSLEEGMASMLDESEGAGLGLTMMVLMLKKIGLNEENYQVISENGETITRMILPFSKKSMEDFASLSKKFVNLIEGLPEFPENITAINRLINDPDSSMTDIARKISNDVSLTGELLKLVNSAAFALATPCSSIDEAVKFTGIRGIRNLLFSVGSMQALMVESDPKKKALWDHSYRVAFYAYTLARSYFHAPEDKHLVEDSYVCGLLHDMGKIIFVTATADIYEKMSKLCAEKDISTDLFERMVAGVNHGEVGALVAQKWNFPDAIIEVIRYHHDTASASDKRKKLTCLIHFADLLAHYSEGIIDWSNFETDELKLFSITDEVQVKELSEKMDAQFRNSER